MHRLECYYYDIIKNEKIYMSNHYMIIMEEQTWRYDTLSKAYLLTADDGFLRFVGKRGVFYCIDYVRKTETGYEVDGICYYPSEDGRIKTYGNVNNIIKFRSHMTSSPGLSRRVKSVLENVIDSIESRTM